MLQTPRTDFGFVSTTKLLDFEPVRHLTSQHIALFAVSFLAVLTNQGVSTETNPLEQTEVFVSGTEGYHTYRIPAIIATPKGALLAFCEGRKSSAGDSGDIDLLLKRSTNGGKSWTAQTVVWDDGPNTCGNPCAVVDQQTGDIWLLLTHNLGADTEARIKVGTSKASRTVWVCHSRDDGRTWSPPAEITSQVKDPAWGWYATGPGVGIQIKSGAHQGRLVIPCDHSYDAAATGSSEAKIEFGSHVIFSDDHGATWKLGGVIRPKVNECQVVELADGQGTLLLNMRSYQGSHRRAEATSRDGGLTWTPPSDHAELIEPVCQASFLRLTWPGEHSASQLLFSNPADEKRRRNFTVRLSRDDGKTWPVTRTLHEGAAAYSCLVALPDGKIGCLYERGETNAYERISFAAFTLDWLTARTEVPASK